MSKRRESVTEQVLSKQKGLANKKIHAIYRDPNKTAIDDFNQSTTRISEDDYDTGPLDTKTENGKKLMSIRNPRRNLYRVINSTAWNFTCGLTDGALGALLPTIEEYYGISYAVVSLLWLGNAIGYIIIAFTGHHIDNYFGKQKMAVLSCFGFIIMYAIASSGTKFPVLVIGWLFGGIGGGSGLSQLNIFLTKMENSSKYLGLFHGSYGLGALVSPLIATSMINKGVPWHYYYFILLGLAICNAISMSFTFKGYDEDLAKWEREGNEETEYLTMPIISDDMEMNNMDPTQAGQSADLRSIEPRSEEPIEKHNFLLALKDQRTWLTCSFIFFYQGAEVSLGGWIVTFVLEYRSGDPKTTGYVSSGFWAGITVGRFLLTSFLSRKVGVRRSIIICSLTIILLDILVWLVPSAMASSIFVSLVGLCIGPIYPMIYTVLARILPENIKFCALTLATAFGSSGGSAIPFAVGMASEFTGTYVLHPIVVASYGFLLVSWVSMPNIERRGEHKTLWQKFW